MQWFHERIGLLREMLRRPWARRVAFAWACLSTWDLVVSQILPEHIAKDAPKLWQVTTRLLSMTSGWIPWWGWLLVGMALLVACSIEFAFRSIREDERRRNYLASPENTEKDMLDYLVEGLQAMDDINRNVVSSSQETERFAKMLNRSARIVPFITNFKLRRKFLSRVAARINAYSRKLQKTADIIGIITPAVRDNQTRFIEGSTVSSQNDKEALRNFAAAAGVTIATLPETIKSMEGMRGATIYIRGISGDLNAASSNLAVVLDNFIGKIRVFGEVTQHVQTVTLKKLTDAENVTT